MANPVNRTELLARVFAARAEIGNLFTSLDPAQFVAPGIQGQWSAKDIAAHVTWWDAWLVGLLRQAAAGQELSAGEWMDLDARNELIYQAHRDEPAEQVLAEFARVGEELRQAIEPLSEEALYAMGRYSGPGERGLARLISDNTFDHYGSHRRPILAWLAEASPDPLPYYATQGPVTYPRGLFWMLDDLPSDIPALVATLQGLLLHPYTMRNENPFLPADFRTGTDPDAYGDVFGAYRTYFATGIDGVFTDQPDTGLLAREDFVND